MKKIFFFFLILLFFGGVYTSGKLKECQIPLVSIYELHKIKDGRIVVTRYIEDIGYMSILSGRILELGFNEDYILARLLPYDHIFNRDLFSKGWEGLEEEFWLLKLNQGGKEGIEGEELSSFLDEKNYLDFAEKENIKLELTMDFIRNNGYLLCPLD